MASTHLPCSDVGRKRVFGFRIGHDDRAERNGVGGAAADLETAKREMAIVDGHVLADESDRFTLVKVSIIGVDGGQIQLLKRDS